MAADQQVASPATQARGGLAFDANGAPVPVPTPLAAPFFDAAAQGRLVLPRCPRKGFFFYPRQRCPCCLAADWTWQEASPEAVVVSYTIDHRGMVPAFKDDTPFGIAIFELVDGVRMPGRVREGLDRLRIGARARAVAVPRGDVHVFEFVLA